MLKRYRQLRMYDKEGHRQKGREIVKCRFGIALEALTGLLDDAQRAEATKSWRASEYEFGWTPPPPLALPPPPYVAPVGVPSAIHLYRDIEQIELSVRTYMCLKNEGIRFLGEVARKCEAELLRIPNFGRKSLNELKEVLAQVGLHLGQDLPDWPPPGHRRPVTTGRQTARACGRTRTVRAIGELSEERRDQLRGRTGPEVGSRDAADAQLRTEVSERDQGASGSVRSALWHGSVSMARSARGCHRVKAVVEFWILHCADHCGPRPQSGQWWHELPAAADRRCGATWTCRGPSRGGSESYRTLSRLSIR